MSEHREPVTDCTRCMHYYITHDADFPYGCRELGFKSRMLPSREVFAASNAQCLAFAQKASAQ